MPVVTSSPNCDWLLRDCIARPDDGDRRFPLIDHLLAVASGCGRPDGSPKERLGFLAGLAHDAAKSARDWQHYIRNVHTVKKGPPHAPLGAALFAFWADNLIPKWSAGDRALARRLHDLALDWTRMVYDHHGSLEDLPENVAPWTEGSGGDFVSLLATCDRAGLAKVLREFFPECDADLDRFAPWLERFDDRWHCRRHTDRPNLLHEIQRQREKKGEDVPLAPEGMRLAALGARLIFADRSHAADWDVTTLEPADAARAVDTLERHCQAEAERKLREEADPALVAARGQAQSSALEAYFREPDVLAYTLELPTGYGKTLNGLRIALEACRRGRCRRLIYVAPYLSILSQAAKVIAEATGLEVFVHHHLTAATLEDHQPYDLLETWQAPVLATTFNQLFRALFPRRAQQCLRIPALDDAFLFIDEPQIVDVTVWNLFLRALAVVGCQRRCQVLFSTATLPPTVDGLGTVTVPLVASSPGSPAKDRYCLHYDADAWKAKEVGEQLRQRFHAGGGAAVILNTIRDAVAVYQQVTTSQQDGWFFLTAMMLPGHKAARIAEIRERLSPTQPRSAARTGVVCTQILEAGVDLSFRSLLRAVPIFSSVTQAAGRANRHGEGAIPAEVLVFPFHRDDGTHSRRFVYRDATACRHTDAVLQEHPVLAEREIPAVLRDYYERCRSENAHTACLEQFSTSAHGQWSALAGLKPLDDGAPEHEMFIPGTDRYLDPRLSPLMDRLAPGGSSDLLARYRDPAFRRQLGFLDRKRLSALLRQFTVGVPRKLAERIANPTPEHDWLWVLNNPADYSDETGLAHLYEEGTDDISCTIF
jgi:CRISPR-associated endonuclease/helicase Cas3